MAMYALSSGWPPAIRVERSWNMLTQLSLGCCDEMGLILIPVLLVNPASRAKGRFELLLRAREGDGQSSPSCWRTLFDAAVGGF